MFSSPFYSNGKSNSFVPKNSIALSSSSLTTGIFLYSFNESSDPRILNKISNALKSFLPNPITLGF